MGKYEVYIHKTKEFTIVVEAEDEGSAEEAGLKLVIADPDKYVSDYNDYEVIEAIHLTPDE